MTPFTLEEAEREIRDTYVWFSEQAPGVTPQEIGRLGQLWSFVDREIARRGDA